MNAVTETKPRHRGRQVRPPMNMIQAINSGAWT